jgi:GNAT superfamily N-acetyltransferase
VHLDALGHQPVAGTAGFEELGVHVLRHGDGAVAVADRRMDDVQQRHGRAAVRRPDGVEQLRADRHRGPRVAGAHLLESDPQMRRQGVGRQLCEQRCDDVRSSIGHDQRL